MPLREGELHIGFRGGVNTKSDEKSVPSVQLLAAQNVVFTRGTSLSKRNGYESLSHDIEGSADTVTDAFRCANRGDELLEFTPNRCYSRQTGVDQLTDTGAVFSVVESNRPLVKTGTQQTMPDAATLSGVTVSAWEDSAGGVWWSVTDSETGRVFRAATQADSAGRSPRCVPVGDVLHVYYAVPTQRRIMVLVVVPTAPSTAVTPAILVDDLDATQSMYDACPTERTGSPAAVAWFESATTAIRIGYVDASGVIGSPLTGHPSALTYAADRIAASPIGLSFANVDGGAGDLFALAWVATATDATTAFLSGGSTSAVIGATAHAYVVTTVVAITRCAVAFVADNATAWSAWEETAAAASNRFCLMTSAHAVNGASGTVTTQRSLGLASRAFAIGEDAFATFVHDTTYFNTYLVLRLSDSVCVGRLAPAAAAGAPTRQHLSSAPVVDSVASIALPTKTRLFSENNDKFTETGVRLFELDFDNDASHQTAQLGAGLYLAGACPQHYDGRVWTEQGFHGGPELIVTVTAGGGSMTSSTTYLYRAWYEWPDAQGEIVLGPVSAGTLVTMGGADTQVTLTLPTCRATKKAGVRIGVARSEAAKTGRTASLYRVTSLDPSTSGSANGYVASSPSSDTVSFLDRMSDTTLLTQEPLYTNGGVLSDDPAELGSHVTRGLSRLFFTDPSDGNLIRYSQQIDDGYGVEIPPELMLPVDPFGGDVTALAFMDGNGIAFKESAIFTFNGDGPTATGDTATQGFSTPRKLPGTVGCTEPASIVEIPAGLMFKAAEGIHLLGRDGSVTYIGAMVEAYNSQTVRRATVLPNRTAVVFLTDSGVTLHYDYFHGQWSWFTNHEGHDAAVVGGLYHYLRTDGRMFRETPGQYSDDGTRIELRLETAWIHMQEQLQGFSQFWHLHLLGTRLSAHQLGIQYQTDYTPGWTDAYYLDATGLTDSTGWITGGNASTIGVDPITGTAYGDGEYGDGSYGGTSPGVYQWRLDLNEHGQSIQFRFFDFEADGYAGASFELTEMLILGGVRAHAIRPFIAARST